MPVFPRVLFDEAHSQAWSIRSELAAQMNPGHPADASYAMAADRLRAAGQTVTAHTEGALDAAALQQTDVLVLAHPAERQWERTTNDASPKLAAGELTAVEEFVRGGGGLVVLGECEQDKYGNNANELLQRFGLGVEHTTVQDARHNYREVASWPLADFGSAGEGAADAKPVNAAGISEDLLARVDQACFYRSATVAVQPERAEDPRVLCRSSNTADPAGAPLAVTVNAGSGRVAVLGDSDIFGDDSIADLDNAQLWTNVITWAAGAAMEAPAEQPSAAEGGITAEPSWRELAGAVSTLRGLQESDGSVPSRHEEAAELVGRIIAAIEGLLPRFRHDEDYLRAAIGDLQRWRDGGFAVPDFLDSLLQFRPETQRQHGLQHLVVFPMYTQNGNPNRNMEALIVSVVWPDWLAELESSEYDNPMFVPVAFADAAAFTEGYQSNSAVLFPETVATRETPKFTWGAIFCDREAARFRAVSAAAARTLRLDLPPEAANLLSNQQLAQNTYVLWDLIHDRTHSHGDLPFDPFMIKQRMPYWMYALEELRCDLNAFRQALSLQERGMPYGRLVAHTILFDRLFRFPITGERVKNYDGLGGQLLFAYLHKHDALRWTDNALSIDWTTVGSTVLALADEVEALYRDGIDRSKVGHWFAAYNLVAGYVAPHPASTWVKGPEALPMDAQPRELVDYVLADEFPLNTFYEALRKKLKDVIASTEGITA